MIVQKIKKELNETSIAEKYYGVISVINSLNLTNKEIQLIAYTAINGNISYKHLKDDFCKKYNTTNATINNIVYKLKKIGVFIKNDGKIKVNPVITLDFKKDVLLAITLSNETT